MLDAHRHIGLPTVYQPFTPEVLSSLFSSSFFFCVLLFVPTSNDTRTEVVLAVSESVENIREFVLVRDNQECCFGPGAALYDCIMVTMAPGKSINFSTRVVAVKGVLEIDTESFLYPDSEEHYAIYKMTAEEVK